MVAKHHFDSRELLIAVVVFVGALALFTVYDPSGQVTGRPSTCFGGSPDGFCDYGFEDRCEVGCADCECLEVCTKVCRDQGKFLEACDKNYNCECTDEIACIK